MKLGKIKKKALLAKPLLQETPTPSCALCKRTIVPHQIELHHMIPKSKGGKETQTFHSICHRQVHALFTENELAVYFNTVEALQNHPDMAKFIAWIKTKPIDYKDRSRKSNRLK